MPTISIIIGLLFGLCQFLLGCAKKSNKNIKTARSIGSPSVTPKKEEPEEEKPPSPIDLRKCDTSAEVKIIFRGLREWFNHVVRRYFEHEILCYENKQDYVLKKKWFLSSDKNPKLNRYKDPKCYDFSRVVLANRKNDYINASWMVYTSGKNILTQGPLSNTISDFWAMICQEKVEYIVMLCSFIEKDVEQCAQYYPIKEGEVEKYEEFRVKNIRKEKDPVKGVSWTILEVMNSDGKPRKINHIQVSWWPDKSAPEDAKLTIELYRWLRKSNKPTIPMVYHCDSGVGRSACFLALDMFLKIDQKWYDELYKSQTTERIDNFVRDMRNGAIDSPLLQIFLLACILEFCYQEKHGKDEDCDWLSHYGSFMEDYKKYCRKLTENPNVKIELPKSPVEKDVIEVKSNWSD